MSALLAASHPLPPAARAAFLEHCAREIANLPELGDGVLHRSIRPSIAASQIAVASGRELVLAAPGISSGRY
jgi:hypothetical protein